MTTTGFDFEDCRNEMSFFFLWLQNQQNIHIFTKQSYNNPKNKVK